MAENTRKLTAVDSTDSFDSVFVNMNDSVRQVTTKNFKAAVAVSDGELEEILTGLFNTEGNTYLSDAVADATTTDKFKDALKTAVSDNATLLNSDVVAFLDNSTTVNEAVNTVLGTEHPEIVKTAITNIFNTEGNTDVEDALADFAETTKFATAMTSAVASNGDLLSTDVSNYLANNPTIISGDIDTLLTTTKPELVTNAVNSAVTNELSDGTKVQTAVDSALSDGTKVQTAVDSSLSDGTKVSTAVTQLLTVTKPEIITDEVDAEVKTELEASNGKKVQDAVIAVLEADPTIIENAVKTVLENAEAETTSY